MPRTAWIVGTPMSYDLWQAQPRDVLPRVARQVDRIVAVDERHLMRIADHDVEGRRAADRLLGACGNQARDQHLAVAIAYLGPRRPSIAEQQRRRRDCSWRR